MPAQSKPGRPPARRLAKRHTGRQRKLLCISCGFIAYASATACAMHGLPVHCDQRMSVPNLRDLVVIDPVAWQARVDSAQSLGQYHAMLRETGGCEDMMLGSKSADATRRKGLARKALVRCSSEGCGCYVVPGTDRCSNHPHEMPF